MNDTPDLVLCIPGPWRDRAELAESIAASDTGYLLDGGVLRDTLDGFACDLLLEGSDPDLAAAFAKAGPHWAASSAMAAVADHDCVIYLAGKGGSRAAAEAMMRAAGALVEAGGLGVKVESTGIAHGPAYWLDMCFGLEQLTAHRALVVYVTGKDVFSCGMHNFGLPDAMTTAVDQAAAADMLRTFTRYLLEQAPLLADGHTFSVSAGAPVYRLRKVPARDYGPDSLFNNPYGAWRLEPEHAQAQAPQAVQPEKRGGWWKKVQS
ncbi:DUF4261 domain-containing protein [Massilia sp. GCM10023247]|uniref:DUF4261 domain-containing protein n=1 Tax=Massilia sp. GCM10023247 TaxID=3252643 RepID=UPI00361FF5ED